MYLLSISRRSYLFFDSQIWSLFCKKLKRNIIQELDGLQILKRQKQIKILPQYVDELLIPRVYDMLLVKPTWSSLKVQGSGLNILAIGKDKALEN